MLNPTARQRKQRRLLTLYSTDEGQSYAIDNVWVVNPLSDDFPEPNGCTVSNWRTTDELSAT